MRNATFARTLSLTIALIAAGSLARADLIVEYDVASNRSSSMSPTVHTDGISADSIDAHGVSVLRNYTGTYVANNWAKGGKIDPNKYFEWSIAPENGKTIAFESLTMGLLRGKKNHKKHGAESWALYASTDGFTGSSLELFDMSIADSKSDNIVVFDTDLTALGLQDDEVTFRLYGYDYTDSRDYSGFGNVDGKYGVTGPGSNIQVRGQVFSGQAPAVPEPATTSLILLGGGALILRRRRG